MTLAGPLTALDAYRITEIPRRPDAGKPSVPSDQPSDPGRTQRLAALVAAYHAVAAVQGLMVGALALGWVRHQAAVRSSSWRPGPAWSAATTGRGPPDPAGRRAGPAAGRGALGPLMSELPRWRAIGGISDGLRPAAGGPGTPAPPSLEECLLAIWPGPFGWLLMAEPPAGAEIGQIADELAGREEQAAGIRPVPERPCRPAACTCVTPSCAGPSRAVAGTAGRGRQRHGRGHAGGRAGLRLG